VAGAPKGPRLLVEDLVGRSTLEPDQGRTLIDAAEAAAPQAAAMDFTPR